MSEQGYPPVPPTPSAPHEPRPAPQGDVPMPGQATQQQATAAYPQAGAYQPQATAAYPQAGAYQPQARGAQVPPAHPQQPGQVPSAYPYGQPVYAPVQQPAEPPRKRRAWIGWVVAAVVLGMLVLGCVLPFVALFSGDDATPSFGDAVAVIPIDGIIAGTGDTYGGYITPEYLRSQLDMAEEDTAVKAIVLRVNSPGGTVAASEELAAYVKQCSKPVVVSIGDVGASGAYMLASQSDEIWAMPGSSVGSIGVITEIPNVAGLLDKVGVEFTVITAGKYKDAGSPYRDLTKEELALIQGEVDEAYDQFIGIVADGRDMKRSEVETLATGWAWSGQKAKELGLVDKLGTYEDALDAAAKRGKIEGNYEVITYDEPLGDLFGSLLTVTTRLDDIVTLLEDAQLGAQRPLTR